MAGVLADYNFGNVTGTWNFPAAPAVFSTLTGVEKEKSFWDAGGRIGWLITPDILSYFSGGYSSAHFDGMTLQPFGAPGLSVGSHNYGGWFTGAGIETKIESIPRAVLQHRISFHQLWQRHPADLRRDCRRQLWRPDEPETPAVTADGDVGRPLQVQLVISAAITTKRGRAPARPF